MATMPMEACALLSSNYTELNTAKLACALDHDCTFVVDEGCDENGPFQLCRKQQLREGGNNPKCMKSGLNKEGMKNTMHILFSGVFRKNDYFRANLK